MNTEEFIDGVRRSGQLSVNDPAFTDEVILEEGSQALIERFAQPVTALRQGYWIHTTTSTTDGNTSGLYRLPPRAVVQGLEKLEFSIDSVNFYQLNILTQQQATPFSNGTTGSPVSYTLEGDCVRLFPYPPSGYTLRFKYYLRPPTLIEYADESRVTPTGVTGQHIFVDQADVGIEVGGYLDVQSFDGSHELVVVDALVVAITPVIVIIPQYDIQVASTVDLTRVTEGMYVRVADEAVFPTLPKELHRPLCDYVAAVILTSKGDATKAAQLAGKAENGIKRVVDMAQPRIKNAPFTWKSQSYLRNNVRRWR
jgi:hypothetical protein